MASTVCDKDFEQSLLSLAGMCHSVALSLTRSSALACQLGEETMLRAWADRDQLDLRLGLKRVLLTRLRNTYLTKYKPRSPLMASSRRPGQTSRIHFSSSKFLLSSSALTN